MRVGIVDDERCEKHIQTKDHQECPNRLRVTRKYLKGKNPQKIVLYDKLIQIQPLNITLNDLLNVHNPDYLNVLSKLSKRKVTFCDDVIANKNSVEAALVAAGGVMAAVDTVIRGHGVSKVFCNIRPPGHHASASEAAGFCLLNNVAIGVSRACSDPRIKKVLIFDWDLHHGDGTQEIFKNNPQVLYCSFHCSYIYPHTGQTSQGNIYNYPLDENVTIQEYMNKFYTFLGKAYDFQPDIVFISCGFDSHKDDIYHVLPLDYGHFEIMTRQLCKLANSCCKGRLVSVLEGGYDVNVLAKCVFTHIQTLLENA